MTKSKITNKKTTGTVKSTTKGTTRKSNTASAATKKVVNPPPKGEVKNPEQAFNAKAKEIMEKLNPQDGGEFTIHTFIAGLKPMLDKLGIPSIPTNPEERFIHKIKSHKKFQTHRAENIEKLIKEMDKHTECPAQEFKSVHSKKIVELRNNLVAELNTLVYSNQELSEIIDEYNSSPNPKP